MGLDKIGINLLFNKLVLKKSFGELKNFLILVN